MLKQNVLLILVDQMRGDCMSIAGHKNVKTPYLDSIAVNGTLFENAYSACPSCIPARAELYTGLSQKHHGRVGYEDGIPWNYKNTIADSFAKAGYYTQCVGKMHVHPLRSMQGFHNIELHDGYLEYYRNELCKGYERQIIADDYFYWLQKEKGIGTDVVDTGLGGNSCLSRPWMYEEQYHPTNWVATRSLDFLRRRDREKPFFLMASFVRPHAPLDAPQCYFDMYKDMNLEEPYEGDWNSEISQGDSRCHDSIAAPKDPVLVRQQRIGYYACITHLDHQIGRIIQELAVQKLLDNTTIVVTADHGDQLCDHGLNRKGFPYRGSIHIPMIVSGGQLQEKHRDVKSKKVVGLRDVMPTVLNIAGIQSDTLLDGINMLGEEEVRDYLHGEHALGKLSNHYIVTETEKYIWYSQTGCEQFFDLEQDPYETRDLIKDKSKEKRIEACRQLLIQELKDREEGYSDGTQLFVGKQPQTILNTVSGY